MDPHTFDPAALKEGLEDPERRAFTLTSILALLGGVTITITGCGDSYSPPSPGPPPAGGATAIISANHGHSATITSAQLSANNALTLQLVGGTHPHTVVLSAQEVSQIAAQQRVSKTSSTDPSPDAGTHSHIVTFN